jgi:hypothetical protein
VRDSREELAAMVRETGRVSVEQENYTTGESANSQSSADYMSELRKEISVESSFVKIVSAEKSKLKDTEL